MQLRLVSPLNETHFAPQQALMAQVSWMQMRGAETLSLRQLTTSSLRSRRRLAVRPWTGASSSALNARLAFFAIGFDLLQQSSLSD